MDLQHPYVIAGATVAAVGAAYLFMNQPGGPVRTTWKPPKASELSPYQKGGKSWDVNVDGKLDIKLAKEGVASLPPMTVPELMRLAADKGGDSIALNWEDPNLNIQEWTWKEYVGECERAALAFVHLGLQAHEAVNIIGFNSPEWFMANNGAILAGGKSAGIYTTNGPDACKYIAEHSEARIVVVENEAQLAKFKQVWKELPRLKAIVVYRPAKDFGVEKTPNGDVYSWTAFMALADKGSKAEVEKRQAAMEPGTCCLLIYTSGTTGPPKAVMISHDNIFFTGATLMQRIDGNGFEFGGQPEAIVSYLPLSHIAAQMADIWAPVYTTAMRPRHVTVYFARPDALKGTLGTTLKRARPTFFFGVPRVWEKMMETMKAVGAKNTGAKKKISAWARGIGAEYWKNRQLGGSAAVPFGYALAKKLVFSKVRLALGLDRCRIQFTGAAPMALEVFQFFAALDIPVYELYGMSECTGPQTVSYFYGYKQGSTGQALEGTEIRIDHCAGRDKEGEGEICYRGRHIMMGYMKQPEKTKETIDPEGFLHSGDVGRLDENGMLSITGRIKELIITAGGENIAPVPVEDRIKAACPGLSNVMMVGDRRKYNVCLVTLKTEINPETQRSTPNLTGDALAVSSAKTVAEAKEDPAWTAYINAGIKAYNDNAVSQAQKIQKFAILPEDFSVAEELTPTLKLKRDVTAKKYSSVIETLYA